MDDLIKWEPQDNQHLAARVLQMPLPLKGFEDWMFPCCGLCGCSVPRDDDKYCGRCGARLEWEEGE